jgi:hypothetical protein
MTTGVALVSGQVSICSISPGLGLGSEKNKSLFTL